MKKTATILFLISICTVSAWGWDAPTMGWSSWNAYGHKINESIIKSQADALESTGLRDAGYVYLNIDDGAFCGRDDAGHLRIHPERFPNGMKNVVEYINSKGLKAGTYSDAGNHTCASFWGGDTDGLNTGLYTHDIEDINFLFKDLGFEFIKVDFCGGDANQNVDHLALSEQERYTAIGKAIKDTGIDGARFNVCRWAYPGTWVQDVATSWRVTQDIYLGWESVKDIIHQNLYLSAYATKGRFNDMDMLEVGRGLSKTQDETHFAMWCVMSSPLLLGCDLATITPSTLALITNPELIAINQDPLALQAHVVNRSNGAYILVKDYETLRGNKRVVALYNPTNTAVDIEIDFFDIELAGKVKMRDAIGRKDMEVVEDHYVETVSPQSTRVYVLEAKKRIPRTNYEAETGWITAYQELDNNQVVHSGVYEEADYLSGGAKACWLGNREDNDLCWNEVYSETGGEYTMTLYFIAGEDRNVNVELNGEKITSFNGNSGGWSTIGSIEIPVILKAGENKIRLYSGENWMPDFDRMTMIEKGSLDFYKHEFDVALRKLNEFDRAELPAGIQQMLEKAIAEASGEKLTGDDYTEATAILKEALNEAEEARDAYHSFTSLLGTADSNLAATAPGEAYDSLNAVISTTSDAMQTVATAAEIIGNTDLLIAGMKAHLTDETSELLPDKSWDATILIKNPNFDSSTSDWTGSAVWGYGCAEHWNKTFSTSQTISGLRNGFYTLGVQALYRLKANDGGTLYKSNKEEIPARLIANSSEVPVVSLYSCPIADYPELAQLQGTDALRGYVNSMYGASEAFKLGLYPNKVTTEVTDHKLVATVRSDSKIDDCWCCFDNFSLTYHGNNNDHVSDIESDEVLTEEYFNLQGIRIKNPETGQFVIRKKNKRGDVILVK